LPGFITVLGLTLLVPHAPQVLAAEDCVPSTSDDYVQCVMNGVIVSGIWGRAGNDGGVEKLIDGDKGYMRSVLVNDFKVPPANIYVQGWNSNNDSNPNNAPSTDVHQRRFVERLNALGKIKPSYFALVGHSFGGWSSLKLSRLSGMPTPDLLFTIDPVIGAANNGNSEDTRGNAKLMVNFYQTNYIESLGDVCGVNFTVLPCIAGLSCGRTVHNTAPHRAAQNIHLPYQAWSDGSYIIDRCLVADVNRAQTHTSIDQDRFVIAEASRVIVKGVGDLKAYSEKLMVDSIIRSLGEKVTSSRLAFFTDEKIKTQKSGQLRSDYRNFRMDQIYTQVLGRLPNETERKWTHDFFKKGGTSQDLATCLYLSLDLIGANGRTISLENIFYQYLLTDRNIDKVVEVLLGIDKTVYTYTWNDQNKTCNRSPRNMVVANAKCGKSERQVIIHGATCDISYNGEYRFTLKAGQEECPKAPAPMTGPVPSGFYQIKNRFSQKCIDLKDASNKDGASLQQLSCNRGTNQAFNLNNVSGDLYVMTIWSSQQCLSAETIGMDSDAGVVQHGCNFLSEQNVRILPSAASGSYLMQFENSSKCVDVAGLSRDNNREIIQSDCSGEADQDWVFVSTDPFNNPDPTLATDVSYEIVGDFSDKCLDVKGSSELNGASLQQWQCTGAANQRYRLMNVGDGFYRVSNISSGKCLRAESGKSDNGTRMVLWDCNDNPDQKIRLEPSANETFNFRFAHSKKCMDVAGTSTDNGKEVHQWDCSSSTPDQKWSLREVEGSGVPAAPGTAPAPNACDLMVYPSTDGTSLAKPSSFDSDMNHCGKAIQPAAWSCSWVSADKTWIIPELKSVVFTADRWGASKYNIFSFSTVKRNGCIDPEALLQPQTNSCDLISKGYKATDSTGNIKPSSFATDMAQCGSKVKAADWSCQWVSADETWIIPALKTVIFTADRWGKNKYNVFSFDSVRKNGCKNPESFR
jgi:hypothetical protein